MTDTYGQRCFDWLEGADLASYSGNRSQASREGSGLRECSICGQRKPRSEYHANSKGHLRNPCKECWNERERRRKEAMPPKERSAKFREYRRSRRAKVLCSVAKNRAKRRGIAYSLTVDDVAFIQGVIDAGACELTGLPFNLDDGKTWDSPSLDRIDSQEGYTITNVRVVLYCLNVMANEWGHEKILDIADAMRARALECPSRDLQERLTTALAASLDLNCSPEYELTWKRVAMPSGAPICRLRASARRTGGSDCSGWPTPRAADHEGDMEPHGKTGRKLQTIAAWATPAARDWKSESATDEFNAERDAHTRGKPLSYQATLAGWNTPRATDGSKGGPNQTGGALPADAAGATTESSPANQASGGALNPALSRWLMGYPAEWLSCVDWGTR